MARTTGPLLSMDASGTVGGSLVFSKWKGRNYVRKHVVPHNPQTALQTGVRSGMAFCSKWASSDKTTTKAIWQTKANNDKISPHNAFVKAFMMTWRVGLIYPLGGIYPAAIDTGVLSVATATSRPRSVDLTWTLTSPDVRIGYFIYASTTTGFVPALSNCIGQVFNGSVFTDRDMAIAVPMFYRIAGISSLGAYRLYSNQMTGTPTA